MPISLKNATKRVLSLLRKDGQCYNFLIEKKAVGLQPLVAVFERMSLLVLVDSRLVLPSSASFEDDIWGVPGAAVIVVIAQFT